MSGQGLDSYIIKAFRGKGYKATPQRIAISRFALHDHNHPSTQRIFKEVKKVYPTISLRTIYKTIQILKEIGLIQELNLPKDHNRFDPNMEPHVHLLCLRCHGIEALLNPFFPEIIEKVSDIAGFVPVRQNFDILGICSKCDGK